MEETEELEELYNSKEYKEMQEFEKDWDALEERNETFLELFEKDLKEANLKEKTIKNHLSNVSFYINEFLPRADLSTMEKGVSMLEEYFGYFFIHKCMWATPASVKSTAASLKKFYKCMAEHEMIPKKDYEALFTCIKESMDMWQEDCALENDPDFWDSIL